MEIKNCPFCHGVASDKFDSIINKYYVVCQLCESRSAKFNLLEQAVEKWNTREVLAYDLLSKRLEKMDISTMAVLFDMDFNRYKIGGWVYETREEIIKQAMINASEEVLEGFKKLTMDEIVQLVIDWYMIKQQS